MGKLASVARTVLGNGGEYIAVNDLIADYPDGVTVVGAFVIDTKEGSKRCLTFAEDPYKYFYAESGDLVRLYESWLTSCNGDINELNDALCAENIKIKIQKKKTKSNKTYTKAWVVGVVEKNRYDENEFIDAETGELIKNPGF